MISFNYSEFEEIFPFYVRIDKDLRIISSGKSIRKVIGNVNGRSFEEAFKFIRPSMTIQYDFESMKRHQNVIIIVESVEFPVKTRFRGQFIFRETENEIIYLNSPWITDSHDLGFHNLLVSDFALHDTITDNLQLLHSKQIVLEDMKKIADELITQRNELLEKNETIIELARFPDQNPQPVLRMDFEGKVLYSNDLAARLINERSLLELPFWGTVYMRFESNGYQNYERDFSIDQSIYHATLVPVKNRNYFNVYLRDITETLEYQNELMNTSSRLHTLISAMHSGILAENIKREIILTNQIFCDIFNIPLDPNKMKGMDCSNAAQDSKHFFENEEGFVERIDHILSDRKRIDGELLKMKDGRILERDFLPIHENGEYLGHIWKYQDVTELMNSKESLRKLEDKYSRIIENLELGLVEVDTKDNITKVYPAFCRMTGYSADELIGKNTRELLAFEADKLELEKHNEIRMQGVASAYESHLRTKAGGVKYVLISGSPIFDINGVIVGSLGVHVDISERKKLEEELLEANNKAVESVKMKEMFVANMSHEIRTPMNVIIGMMDLIGEEGLNDEQKKFLQTIKRSADSLLELINDLLDYSKIEAGQLTLEETNLDLYELFEHLELSFTEKAKSSGVQLLSSIDSKISSRLITDSSKLNQVLINLVSNAVKFTEAGYIRITAELLSEDHAEQVIKFSVIDTGIGISSENLEAIFETFTQEDSSVSRKYGGTGLGLTISQQIVSKFGGELKVNSTKGKGSEFYFIIKFLKGIGDISVEVEPEIADLDSLNMHILVAEDNPFNQTLISSILKKTGVSFDLANNGKEVIDLMSKVNYDLILLDIQMPLMDGITTTKQIRNVLRSDIPIIALTANASSDDEKLYLSIGMNGYLAKPFRKEELYQLIRETALNSAVEKNNFSRSQNFIEPVNLYSLRQIEDLAGGDDGFIFSIIDTFRTNTPKYMNELRKAISLKDHVTIGKFAHQLKPSLDILEIRDGSRLIRDIEDEVLKNNIDDQLLEKNFNHLIDIINAVIKDLYSKF